MNSVLAKTFMPFVLTATLVCGASCSREADRSGAVLAKAGTRVITLKEYEDAFARLLPPGSADAKEELHLLKKELLIQLIEESLILDEADRMGVSVNDEELGREVEGIEKEYGSPSFKDAITARYGDLAVWKEEIRRKLVLRKVMDKVAALKKGPPPSEEAIKRYYDEHIKEYDLPEQAWARMIVVSAEDEAHKIRKRLTRANFAATAKEVSLSPEAGRGGDLGFFGRSDMPREFEDAVFKLKAGEISKVVKTSYGYHIFLLEERRKSRRLRFDEVREKIRARLVLEAADAQFGKWVEGLKANANIEINEELL